MLNKPKIPPKIHAYFGACEILKFIFRSVLCTRRAHLGAIKPGISISHIPASGIIVCYT